MPRFAGLRAGVEWFARGLGLRLDAADVRRGPGGVEGVILTPP